MNHTECSVLQSGGLSEDCNSFSQVPDGGLAFWQGGGNWGDLWDRERLSLWRMKSFTQLLKKGITVIGMPQSLHYENKDYQSKDAEKWMNAIDTQANETESKAKTILTWRQPDSFETAT